MNFLKENIISQLLLKVSLVFFVFAFSGYHNASIADVYEIQKTELLRSEQINNNTSLYLLSESLDHIPSDIGIITTPIFLRSSTKSISYSDLTIYHCYQSFLNLKPTLAKIKISTQFIPLYSKEDIPLLTLG